MEKFFNRGSVRKTDKGVIGSIELFVGNKGIVTREANEKSVGDIRLTGTFHKKGDLAYALNDEGIFKDEDGFVVVKASFWDKQLELFQGVEFKKGDRILVSGLFTINEFNATDGTKVKEVACSVDHFEKIDGGTKAFVRKILVDGKTKIYGYVDGWIGQHSNLEVRSVEVNGETKQVGEVSVSGKYSKNSGIAYNLGEKAVNENGYTTVSASFWGKNLENIQKFTFKQKDRIRLYGEFELDTYTKQDGTEASIVRMKSVSRFEYLGQPKGTETPTEDSTPAPATDDATAPVVEVESSDEVPTIPMDMGW